MTSRRTATRRRACADRKSTRLNSSHDQISYAVFCLKKKKKKATKQCQMKIQAKEDKNSIKNSHKRAGQYESEQIDNLHSNRTRHMCESDRYAAQHL